MSLSFVTFKKNNTVPGFAYSADKIWGSHFSWVLLFTWPGYTPLNLPPTVTQPF